MRITVDHHVTFDRIKHVEEHERLTTLDHMPRNRATILPASLNPSMHGLTNGQEIWMMKLVEAQGRHVPTSADESCRD